MSIPQFPHIYLYLNIKSELEVKKLSFFYKNPTFTVLLESDAQIA